MKKRLLLLSLLTIHPTPSMSMFSWLSKPTNTTEKVVTSLIIASTLVLSHSKYNNNRSLDLHKALEQNNLTLAQQLINNPKVDVNAKVDYGTEWYKKGWTPLIWCCRTGDKALQIANALLKRNDINVNLPANDGWTPLIRCCRTGDKALHIANALLKRNDIKVNLQDIWGWTPLIRCCYKGDKALQIANALLKRNDINVNLPNNDGFTPLLVCCQTGDKALQIANALLKRNDINVNLQTNKGWTPLIRCCKTGDNALQIANALLKHQDINVNLQANNGWTPLDTIIDYIKQNKENYTYVQLWTLLVAKGGILGKRITDYNNLNPNNFQEPQKGHIQNIKNNPPINISFPHIYQEHNLLRQQLKDLKNTSNQKIAQLENNKNTLNNQLNSKFIDNQQETKEQE